MGEAGTEEPPPWIGDYHIEFATQGCLFGYPLHRSGEYANGVLTLNRPVKEYFALTYQKLYAVRPGTSVSGWRLMSGLVS